MIRPRAFVLVAEGITPDRLDAWISMGLLPHFERLFARGVRGTYRTTNVPYEPPELMTAFTGRAAGDHGWFSYWSAQDARYQPRFLGSGDAAVPQFWRRAELADRRVGVVNILGTHPAEPLNGWMITYPPDQTLRACYPPDLVYELSRRDIHCAYDVSIWFSGTKKRGDFVPRVLDADRMRGRAALDLWDRGADAVVVNLTGPDRLSHIFWHELESGSPIPPHDAAVLHAYRVCDDVVGDVLDRCEGANVLVFSEIGFGPLRGYVSVNGLLADAGLLVPNCWPRTIAYEAVQGTFGINLNLKSRQAEGAVDPGDYERARSDVAAVLEAMVNPYTGMPLFREVRRREEVYAGGAAAGAPDLVTTPFDERYLPLGDPGRAAHVRRHLQSGWHRSESFWSGAGPAFEGVAGGEARAIDILPTIASMLGVTLDSDMHGRSMAEERCAAA